MNVSRRLGRTSSKAKPFLLLLMCSLCALKQMHTLFSLSPKSFASENSVLINQLDWRVGLAVQETPRQHRTEVSASRSHPRVVIESQSTEELPAYLSSLLSTEQDISYLDLPSATKEEQDMKEMEEYMFMQLTPAYQRDCVPMSKWQTTSFPNCNSIHEIDLLMGMKPLGKGMWRKTYLHNMLPGVVVKLLTLDEEYIFDPRAYESMRVDAIVAERLTFSQYVNPIHGFCGTTSVYEQAQGSLAGVAKDNNLSFSQKLRFSFQLAQALADLHGIDYPDGSNSTVVHRDIKLENTLLSNPGVAQLSDFNDSKLRLWNKTSGTSPCPHYNQGFPAHWGIGYKPYEFADTSHPPLTEKMDIYGLGGLLYTLLVGQRPYYNLDREMEKRAVKNGIPPIIPFHLDPKVNSKASEGLRVLVKAIQSCMDHKPDARPTAKSVADSLRPYVQDAL